MRALDLFAFVNRVLEDDELHERLKQDPQGTLDRLATDSQGHPGPALDVETRSALARLDWSDTDTATFLTNLIGTRASWGFSTTDDPSQIQEWTTVFYAQVDSEMASQDLHDRLSRWAMSASPLKVFLYPSYPLQPTQDYVCFVIWYDTVYYAKAGTVARYIDGGDLKPYAGSASAAQVANYQVLAEVVGSPGRLIVDYGILTYWGVKDADRQSFEAWAFDRQLLEQQIGGATFQGGLLLKEKLDSSDADHRYTVLSGYASPEARPAIAQDARMVEFEQQHPTDAYVELAEPRAFARGKQLIGDTWH
jgi:hypothetical protein